MLFGFLFLLLLVDFQMAHDRVVDTSFLFEGSDKKFSTPSLKDVVKMALGKEIQGGSHDSVTDAKVCSFFDVH